jgi:hypothetical protein
MIPTFLPPELVLLFPSYDRFISLGTRRCASLQPAKWHGLLRWLHTSRPRPFHLNASANVRKPETVPWCWARGGRAEPRARAACGAQGLSRAMFICSSPDGPPLPGSFMSPSPSLSLFRWRRQQQQEQQHGVRAGQALASMGWAGGRRGCWTTCPRAPTPTTRSRRHVRFFGFIIVVVNGNQLADACA